MHTAWEINKNQRSVCDHRQQSHCKHNDMVVQLIWLQQERQASKARWWSCHLCYCEGTYKLGQELRELWNLQPWTYSSLTGCRPELPVLADPALSREMNQITSKDSFQPKLFCGSNCIYKYILIKNTLKGTFIRLEPMAGGVGTGWSLGSLPA